MSKQAISVTLDTDNLTWLRGRAEAAGLRSVSELLDHIVGAARASGDVGPSRSVVGTIAIDDADPSLANADAAVRALFDASVRRPMAAKGRSAADRARRRRLRRG
jgi:hypothetical protein